MTELLEFLSCVWGVLNPPHALGVVYADFGASFWIYFLLVGLSYAVSVSMMPKPTTPEAATFDSFDFPQADEGTAQAVIFGDCWSGDWAILALGNFETSPIRKDSGGGK